MNPSSVASSFLLQTSGGAAVPATVTMSSGNTVATLNPSADLTAGVTYTATITTGATDVAGNSMAAPRTWSFTVSADGGGAGDLDKFGITQIYPEKAGGGEKWFMNMQNPNNDPRTDPDTTLVRNPDGSWNVRETQMRYNVFTFTGYHPELITTLDQHATPK
jgi:Bacterial Ig-like domain